MRSKAGARRAMLAVCFSTVLAACGGGGGGGGEIVAPVPAPAPGPAPMPPAPPRFQNFQAAITLVGQADFISAAANQGADSPNATSLFNPFGVAVSDTGALFVADGDNRRVLVLPAVPEAFPHTIHAQFALGQPDVFEGGQQSEPKAYSAPSSIAIGMGKMAVADQVKNRVVIYDAVPSGGEAAPAVVVGQLNFEANDTTTCDEVHLLAPSGVHITPDGKLIVADRGHSRVLIWESIPTANGQPAKVVLGQPDFTTCTQNAGTGPTPRRGSMRLPNGVWGDGTRVAVADTANRRVLLWDQVVMSEPTGQEPQTVLGQGGFDSAAPSLPAETTLAAPRAIAFNGTHFAVADSSNNRVLLWEGWPAQNAQAAQTVIGQRLFSHGQPNDVDGNGSGDGAPNAQALNNPTGVAFHQDKLLVTDRDNNRVLVFKSD